MAMYTQRRPSGMRRLPRWLLLEALRALVFPILRRRRCRLSPAMKAPMVPRRVMARTAKVATVADITGP